MGEALIITESTTQPPESFLATPLAHGGLETRHIYYM